MRVKVNYDFDARNTKELTIRKGDVIEVLNEDPGGWWLGSLNGMQGLFPANYTYIIEDLENTEAVERERSSSFKVDQTKVKPFIRKLQTQCGFRAKDGETETGSLLFGMKGRILENMALNEKNVSEKEDDGEIEEIAETEHLADESNTIQNTSGQSSKLSHLTRNRPTRMSRQQPSRHLADTNKQIADLKEQIAELQNKLAHYEQKKPRDDVVEQIDFWKNKYVELQQEMDVVADRSDSDERISQLEQQLQQSNKSNTSLEQQISQLQSGIESLRNDYLEVKSSFQHEQHQKRQSQDREKALEAEISQLKSENHLLQQVTANKSEESANMSVQLQKSLDKLIKVNKDLEAQLMDEVNNRKLHETECQDLRKKVSEMDTLVAQLREQQSNQETTRDSDLQIMEKNALLQKNKELEVALKKTESTCKSQHQFLEQENIALHQQLKQFKDKFAESERSLSEVKDEKVRLQTELATQQRKIELELEQQKQQTIAREMESHRAQAQRKQLETEIETLKVAINQERIDKQHLEKEIAKLHQQKSETKQPLQDPPKDEEIFSLKETLKLTSQKLSSETQSKVSLEKSVKRLEVELQEFKKRMIDLLVLLENKNLTLR